MFENIMRLFIVIAFWTIMFINNNIGQNSERISQKDAENIQEKWFPIFGKIINFAFTSPLSINKCVLLIRLDLKNRHLPHIYIVTQRFFVIYFVKKRKFIYEKINLISWFILNIKDQIWHTAFFFVSYYTILPS